MNNEEVKGKKFGCQNYLVTNLINLMLLNETTHVYILVFELYPLNFYNV